MRSLKHKIDKIFSFIIGLFLGAIYRAARLLTTVSGFIRHGLSRLLHFTLKHYFKIRYRIIDYLTEKLWFIRFAYKGRRTLEVLIPEFLVSVVMFLLISSGVISGPGSLASGIAGGEIVGLLIIQWFLLKTYCKNVYSPVRAILTIMFVYFNLGALTCFLALLDLEPFYTFFFMPFKFFRYMGITGKTVSAAGVDLIFLFCSLLFPFTYRLHHGTKGCYYQRLRRHRETAPASGDDQSVETAAAE